MSPAWSSQDLCGRASGGPNDPSPSPVLYKPDPCQVALCHHCHAGQCHRALASGLFGRFKGLRRYQQSPPPPPPPPPQPRRAGACPARPAGMSAHQRAAGRKSKTAARTRWRQEQLSRHFYFWKSAGPGCWKMSSSASIRVQCNPRSLIPPEPTATPGPPPLLSLLGGLAGG